MNLINEYAANMEEVSALISFYKAQNVEFFSMYSFPSGGYSVNFTVADSDKTNFEKVKTFHEVFGLSVGNFQKPALNDKELRCKLITEEYNEVLEAIESGDIAEIAKELSDLLYVIYGTGISFGIDLDISFALVHNSNMSKLDENNLPVRREDGKILKSNRYAPPNLKRVVKSNVSKTRL